MTRETPEQRAERLYRQQVGEPRNLPDNHPDVWQWKYRGTREECDMLLEALGVVDDEVPPSQEETLW